MRGHISSLAYFSAVIPAKTVLRLDKCLDRAVCSGNKTNKPAGAQDLRNLEDKS